MRSVTGTKPLQVQNPFARSNDFNDLGDNAFAAQSGVAACVLISVLIGTPTQKSWKFSV
jgi:hypothetical protein